MLFWDIHMSDGIVQRITIFTLHSVFIFTSQDLYNIYVSVFVYVLHVLRSH